MMLKHKIIVALFGVIGSWGMVGCQEKTQKAQEAERVDSTKSKAVEVVATVMDTVQITLEYSTALKASVTNVISTQTGGRLSRLLVKEGDRVSAGQVLGQLDQFNLNQAKIQLDDAKVNYERINELYRIGGVSKAQWEQAVSAMRIAQEAYSNLQGNTILRSPVTGVVTTKNYNVGDMTSPGQPVVVVEQIAPIKAQIQVPEEHYALLKKGLSAVISVDALGQEHFDAHVSNIFPTINPASHTVTVEVEAPNRNYVLRPGMYSRVMLYLGEKEALLVPDRAVMRQVGSGERYVFVYASGKAERRVVQLGALYQDRYEVLSGVEAGEPVIVSSPSTITNGMSVSLNSAE